MVDPHPDGPIWPGPHPARGAASVAVHAVNDQDQGYFTVRTVTASYLLDLHARRLLRCPTYPRLDEPYAPLIAALVRQLDIDLTWLPLVTLTQCEVGQPISATVLIDDIEQPLRSTTVRIINSLPNLPLLNGPPMPRDSSAR